jgi:hypothetical protein
MIDLEFDSFLYFSNDEEYFKSIQRIISNEKRIQEFK